MTYHAYVGEDEEDVHPEEPDRIVGIHQRLQGAFRPDSTAQATELTQHPCDIRQRSALKNVPDSHS